jgi:pyruvate/2-oxoglutarate dehydrogenase complex dihydrolipoamide acyltransferase (E2) component
LFDILKSLAESKPAPHREIPFPVMRNIVLDIMDEGRRKNTIHLLFDADATRIHAKLADLNRERPNDKRITITSYIAKALADTVADMPRLQAYRKGRNKLVLFEDVDLSVMIERKVEQERLPIPYILRAVNKMTLNSIDGMLHTAKSAPLYTSEGPLSDLEAKFFTLPRWIRKCVWFFIRRDPHLFRAVAGTVGLTSLPNALSLRAIGQPITPMTLTLLVGAISPVVRMKESVPVEEHVIEFNLAADHDVVDGAQMMRFMESFKKRLHGEK